MMGPWIFRDQFDRHRDSSRTKGTQIGLSRTYLKERKLKITASDFNSPKLYKGSKGVCGPLVARIRRPSPGGEICSRGAKEALWGCQGSLGRETVARPLLCQLCLGRGRLGWTGWSTPVADMRGLLLLLIRWQQIWIEIPFRKFCTDPSSASTWASRCSRRSSISRSAGARCP